MYPPNTNCLLDSDGEPPTAFWVYNCLQKGRKDEAPTRLLVLGNWQQSLTTWPGTEYLFQGPKAHSRHRQARAITSVQLSKSLELARASCYFSSVCSIKNVAKASQNLKLQLIAWLSIKRIKLLGWHRSLFREKSIESFNLSVIIYCMHWFPQFWGSQEQQGKG